MREETNGRNGGRRRKPVEPILVALDNGNLVFCPNLDELEIGREILAAGLEGELEKALTPLFRKVKRRIIENADRWGQKTAVQVANTDFAPAYREALKKFANVRLRWAIPINPAMRATLQAIYSGKKGNVGAVLVGSDSGWGEDEGVPAYFYSHNGGHITLWFADPWQAVESLGVETADVFLILLGKIADLRNPKDEAYISLDELAAMRGVNVRDGDPTKLREALRREVLKLDRFKVRIIWTDYQGKVFVDGVDCPKGLLDIMDRQSLEGDGVGFTLRCGLALAFFLDPDGLRWIGYYARKLWELNPYHERLAKKIGTYWILTGTAAGKGGAQPAAKIRTILEFCGEAPNPKHPGVFVEAFNKAMRRLYDIGLLWEEIPDLDRLYSGKKGGLEPWLDTVVIVRLSDNIYQLMKPGKAA